MLRRSAWLVFVFVAGIGTVASLGPILDPTDLSVFRLMGQDPSPLEAPAAQGFTTFLGRWIGISMLGSNLLSLGIASTALRRGERWAIAVMAYWPAMFLAHFLLYGPGPMRAVQVGFLVLSTGALVVLARASAPSA